MADPPYQHHRPHQDLCTETETNNCRFLVVLCDIGQLNSGRDRQLLSVDKKCDNFFQTLTDE